MILNNSAISNYPKKAFFLLPAFQLKIISDVLKYINQRGYILFWPIKKITFPRLWTATAGDRPVEDKHDDPGHITCRWKDKSLGKGYWYYAKIIYQAILNQGLRLNYA